MSFKNLRIDKTIEAFRKGCFDCVVVTDNTNTSITIDKKADSYYSMGIYTSDVIYNAPVSKLVLSWNADTPKGTSINIEAQVLVQKGEGETWSDWLSWGTWSLHDERFSAADNHSWEGVVSVDTDTLRVTTSFVNGATALRYRLTLNTSHSNVAPSVRLVAATFISKETMDAYNSPDLEEERLRLSSLEKELQVPRFSQMLRDPKIASVICSPTSITMILDYYGLKLIPEETAACVYDSIYDGYGNWSFNTAFAGSQGFEAYVVFCNSIYDLKKEISEGHPAAVSVKYKNSDDTPGSLPVIHGAPIAKTNGHLIVVCGFINENGKEYVIVNDPAASSDEAVRVKYLRSQFEEAWKTSGRMAYIIHPL